MLRTRRSVLAAPFALTAWRAPGPAKPEWHAERRRRLAESVGRGVIALLGHDEAGGQSGFTGFRQESNFYYLTGHEEPGAALLIAPARNGLPYREALFLPERADRAERWYGPLLSPADAPRLGIDEARGARRLRGALRTLLRERKPLYGLRPAPYGTAGPSSLERLEEIAGTPDIRDARAEIAALRSIKSAGEIALLQAAVEATVTAYRAAWKAVAPGASERSVIAEFVAGAFRAGCERLAFPPIAAAGPNAAILHYRKHASRLRDGQLLLMDTGGERSRYAADIARTVPVGGRYDGEQRRLYALVLGAQQAAISAARPGATLGGSGSRSLLGVAQRTLRKGASRGIDTHLPHALGHHVGLDVHDPAPRATPLKAGMVVTIEPGVYLPGRGLGIRIEDMIEITADGCRVMSADLPSTPEAVERALVSEPSP